jgi:AmmeMemoRadiSam system protein B
MMIREPVVAGHFYAGQADRCRADLKQLLDEAAPSDPCVGQRLLGGLVPHAGWVCSGAVAAKVFRALASSRTPEVIVLFGGVHRYRGREAAMFGSGRWETPLGPVEVDSRLAERILGHTNLIVDDPYAHEDEHSLEVQMPFVKYLFPKAKVVPLMVPVVKTAHEVGEAVGRTVAAYGYDALIVGTTDLTHYGPHYGFVPQGIGAKGNRWAKEVNDRRFIDLVCKLKTSEVVAEATERKNACSSGAAAATLAAVTAMGATEAILLQHTTSSEVLGTRSEEEMADSVGYAGIVFAGE